MSKLVRSKLYKAIILILIALGLLLLKNWYSQDQYDKITINPPLTQKIVPYGALYRQTSNQSDIYTNWDYSFSFKIPSSWQVKLSESNMSVYEESCPSCGGGSHGIDILYYLNEQNTPIDVFIPQINKYQNSESMKSFRSTDGQAIVRLDRQVSGAGEGQQVYISDQNNTKLVSLYCSLCTDQNMNDIINSFTFDVSVPQQLPYMLPTIAWGAISPASGDKTKTPSVYREGSIIVREFSLSDGLYDHTSLLDQLIAQGWVELVIDGASQPFTSYARLSKQINGAEKILEIMIENTTMTQDSGDRQSQSKCPCTNKITVSQEI